MLWTEIDHFLVSNEEHTDLPFMGSTGYRSPFSIPTGEWVTPNLSAKFEVRSSLRSDAVLKGLGRILSCGARKQEQT